MPNIEQEYIFTREQIEQHFLKQVLSNHSSTNYIHEAVVESLLDGGVKVSYKAVERPVFDYDTMSEDDIAQHFLNPQDLSAKNFSKMEAKLKKLSNNNVRRGGFSRSTMQVIPNIEFVKLNSEHYRNSNPDWLKNFIGILNKHQKFNRVVPESEDYDTVDFGIGNYKLITIHSPIKVYRGIRVDSEVRLAFTESNKWCFCAFTAPRFKPTPVVLETCDSLDEAFEFLMEEFYFVRDDKSHSTYEDDND